jgi:hypothetical protein
VRNLWDLTASLLGDFLAWARRLVRPVAVERVVTSSSSKRGMCVEEGEAFDAMVAKIDQAVDEFRNHFSWEETRLNYSVSFSGDRRSYEHHLVTCEACGRRNRLRRRFEGAVCGACKKPLAQPCAAN